MFYLCLLFLVIGRSGVDRFPVVCVLRPVKRAALSWAPGQIETERSNHFDDGENKNHNCEIYLYLIVELVVKQNFLEGLHI